MNSPQTRYPRNYFFRELRQGWGLNRTICILLVVLGLGVVVVLGQLYRMSNHLVRETALANVAIYSEALTEFRTLYTSEVVSRVKRNDVVVTHDYERHDGAIPLPATLSMKLGNTIGGHDSGAKTRLYSDHPFPWRKNGGVHDDFGAAALAALRAEPQRPFYRFEDVDGRPSLRYATADLMRESCVSCHNSHPQSPKTDWQVGDVRGVLEVSLPLDHNISQAQASLSNMFLLICSLCIGGVIGVLLTIRRLHQSSEETRRANAKLAEANEGLRMRQEEVTAIMQSLDAQNEELAEAKQESDRRAAELESARQVALGMMRNAENARKKAVAAEEEVRKNADELAEKNDSLACEIKERQQAQADRERLHQELMDSSRRAGMAEMATGVLHNVGNVLNSVNVSAKILLTRIHRNHGRVENLSKVSDLLVGNLETLTEFVSTDERGKCIPQYLKKLAEHLVSERREANEELNSLISNVEHIKQIVSVQQSYAQVGGILEPIDLTELAEDALRVYQTGLQSMHVEVQRCFATDCVVVTDKHKVLQIMINLVSNAKYALGATEADEKILRIEVEAQPDYVSVIVTDNGIGIDSDNLTRIFNHGFTTKRDGHGFGLHASANAAQVLGGSLSVNSSGVGQGAVFTLHLPRGKELGGRADKSNTLAEQV